MQRSVRIQSQPYSDYKTSQYYSWWVDIWSSSSSFLCDSGQGISPIKYRMLIKMDSEIFVVASLCDCLKVCHHKTSNIIKLAIYQIINRNCQKYKQGIMPQSQILNLGKQNIFHLFDD